MLPASTLTRMDPGIMNVCSESGMGAPSAAPAMWPGLAAAAAAARWPGPQQQRRKHARHQQGSRPCLLPCPASPHNHQPLPAGRCAPRAAGPPRVLRSFGGTAPACAVLPSARQRSGAPPATGAAAPRCRRCRTQARAALCTGGSEWWREGRTQGRNPWQTKVRAQPCCVRQCRQDCPPVAAPAAASPLLVAMHTATDCCPPASCSRLGRREKISTMRVRAAT